MIIKKFYEFFLSKLTLLIYFFIYGDKLRISFFNSFYQGEINIDKGRLITGKNFKSRKNVNLNVTSGTLNIGENVFMNKGVSVNVHKSVSIGNNTLFGEYVCIYDHDHNFKEQGRLIKDQGFSNMPVVIGNNVWIGTGSIILSGAKIGDNSVIAAGSLVKGTVPDGTLFCQKRISTRIPIK